MANTSLDTSDAIELAEMLQFLSDWLAADPDHLHASLQTFLGNPTYTATDLRHDLARFTFLLGSDDGEALFGDTTQ
jgi:hypothetical protein